MDGEYQPLTQYQPPEPYQPLIAPKSFGQKIKSFLIELIKFLIIFGFTFIITFSIANWPAIKSKYDWWKKARSGITEKKYLVVPKDMPNPPEKPGREKYELAENHIFIPKISVDSPIVWNIPEQDIVANLHRGVVHYDQSALPGNDGNVFITGHSSYYWWAQGPYSAIFALLDKLEKGDEIAINYKNQIYVYQVRESQVVNPYQVAIMKTKTGEKILTLMTCVPVGTNFRRLIIKAEQTSPQ